MVFFQKTATLASALVLFAAGVDAQPALGGGLSVGTPIGGISFGYNTGNLGSPISHYNITPVQEIGSHGVPVPENPLAGLSPYDDDGDGYTNDLEIAMGANPSDPQSTPMDANGDRRVDLRNGLVADSDDDGYPDLIERDGRANDPSRNTFDSNGNGKTDLLDTDTDGDGFIDDLEINLASNPNDRESTPIDPDGDDQPL